MWRALYNVMHIITTQERRWQAAAVEERERRVKIQPKKRIREM